MAWEQLDAIMREQRAETDEDRREPPERCPYDGALLEERDRIYHCPLGNYTWRA